MLHYITYAILFYIVGGWGLEPHAHTTLHILISGGYILTFYGIDEVAPFIHIYVHARLRLVSRFLPPPSCRNGPHGW